MGLDVRVLPLRISADDLKVRRGPKVFMSGPSGEDQCVACDEIEDLAVWTADEQLRRAASDAEHLMRPGMVVLVVEYAILPDASPTILRKRLLKIR